MRGLSIPAVVFVLASAGCAKKQVCECAGYVGGTTPANDQEEEARSHAVQQCLEQHGGGTITGCPMPPSMPPPRE